MPKTFRALSLYQPWASAIALGLKHVETRSWATPYSGPILIHAAKCQSADCKDAWIHLIGSRPSQSASWAAHGYRTFFNLPFGAYVATANLAGCIRTEEYHPTRQEAPWGNYGANRFAWVLDDIQPLPQPIPAIGQRGLWDVRL